MARGEAMGVWVAGERGFYSVCCFIPMAEKLSTPFHLPLRRLGFPVFPEKGTEEGRGEGSPQLA